MRHLAFVAFVWTAGLVVGAAPVWTAQESGVTARLRGVSVTVLT